MPSHWTLISPHLNCQANDVKLVRITMTTSRSSLATFRSSREPLKDAHGVDGKRSCWITFVDPRNSFVGKYQSLITWLGYTRCLHDEVASHMSLGFHSCILSQPMPPQKKTALRLEAAKFKRPLSEVDSVRGLSISLIRCLNLSIRRGYSPT